MTLFCESFLCPHCQKHSQFLQKSDQTVSTASKSTIYCALFLSDLATKVTWQLRSEKPLEAKVSLLPYDTEPDTELMCSKNDPQQTKLKMTRRSMVTINNLTFYGTRRKMFPLLNSSECKNLPSHISQFLLFPQMHEANCKLYVGFFF